MTWLQFSQTAALGFCSGMTLGLFTLSIHLTRVGLNKIVKQLGGGSAI